MKFRLITTGNYYPKDKAEKLEKLGFTFEPVDEENLFLASTDFKLDIQNNSITGQQNVNSSLEENLVFIEINTLEELLEFSGEWGSLIIDQDTIQIFDDYLD